MTGLKPRGQRFSVSSEHDESYNIHTVHAYLISFERTFLTLLSLVDHANLRG